MTKKLDYQDYKLIRYVLEKSIFHQRQAYEKLVKSLMYMNREEVLQEERNYLVKLLDLQKKLNELESED